MFGFASRGEVEELRLRVRSLARRQEEHLLLSQERHDALIELLTEKAVEAVSYTPLDPDDRTKRRARKKARP